MKRFIGDNIKLNIMLAEIEFFLGYPIMVVTMPDEHRALARCSISLENNRWSFLCIETELPSLATVCHELIHIVLVVEGYPLFQIKNVWDYTDYRNQIVHMLCNLVLHMEVWHLTELLGFSEANDYHLGNLELLAQVQQNRLFADAYIELILPGRAAYLAQGLLCPSESETHRQLRIAAEDTMPLALELADSIIQVLEKWTPISPQYCANALYDIFDILKVPKEILIVSFPNKIFPNFRKNIFASQNS